MAYDGGAYLRILTNRVQQGAFDQDDASCDDFILRFYDAGQPAYRGALDLLRRRLGVRSAPTTRSGDVRAPAPCIRTTRARAAPSRPGARRSRRTSRVDTSSPCTTDGGARRGPSVDDAYPPPPSSCRSHGRPRPEGTRRALSSLRLRPLVRRDRVGARFELDAARQETSTGVRRIRRRTTSTTVSSRPRPLASARRRDARALVDIGFDIVESLIGELLVAASDQGVASISV